MITFEELTTNSNDKLVQEFTNEIISLTTSQIGLNTQKVGKN